MIYSFHVIADVSVSPGETALLPSRERFAIFLSVVVVSISSSKMHVISGLIFLSQNVRFGDAKGV